MYVRFSTLLWSPSLDPAKADCKVTYVIQEAVARGMAVDAFLARPSSLQTIFLTPVTNASVSLLSVGGPAQYMANLNIHLVTILKVLT